MASANVEHFTDANFQKEVLGSSVPVLVDFWAEWCMPCRMLGPTIDALADRFAGKVKVGKIDIDSNRQIAASFGIASIPTIIIFKDGKAVKKMLGLKSEEELTAVLNEAVGQ
ncbi:MAG: thioredoxin [Phycisphaeraceae bacterium]|nr:thioredoxin [Phycisphaeraceae bacterium]MCW5754683.1 thioredoxin [Phycisphaeraceae bacterium]